MIRSSKRKKDFIGFIIILLVILIIIIFNYFYFSIERIELDKETGCQKQNGADSFTVLLIDNTDSLNFIQKVL